MLRQRFRRAVAVGRGQIDFKNAEYMGFGTRLESGTMKHVHHTTFPYAVYSIRIKQDGQVIDTKEQPPAFVLTRFQNRLKIVSLRFN